MDPRWGRVIHQILPSLPSLAPPIQEGNQTNVQYQARRQGGSRGFERTPLLTSKSNPLVSLVLSLRITAVQTGLVEATVCKFVHGGPAWNVRVSCLRHCDERMRVIACTNKSLVQALESCPFSEVTPSTCCSANLSTFYRENLKSAGLVNAYMDS